MESLFIDFCSWTLILFGSFSVIVGAFGVLRFPDVFTRMHAASVTDTLGAGAIIGGLILQAGLTLIAAKLILVLVFLFFTSPTSSFALAHAALSSGIQPFLDKDLRNKKMENSS